MAKAILVPVVAWWRSPSRWGCACISRASARRAPGTATVDVHLAYNNVLHRLAAFGASNVVLLALWAVLAARLV